MRNFFLGTLPFCISFFCITSASAATVGPEVTGQAFSERVQADRHRERDGGIFSNSPRSGGEGSQVLFEEIVPTGSSGESVRDHNNDDLTAVPIPSTIFLLGGGLFALMFLRRRKSITT